MTAVLTKPANTPVAELLDQLDNHPNAELRERAAAELDRRAHTDPYRHMRTAEGVEALAAATNAQRRRAADIRRSSSAVKGYVLMSDGTLVVGYETLALSRDRNADVRPDGSVAARR